MTVRRDVNAALLEVMKAVPEYFHSTDYATEMKLIYLVRMQIELDDIGLLNVSKIGITRLNNYIDGERRLEHRMKELIANYKCAKFNIYGIAHIKSNICLEPLEKELHNNLDEHRYRDINVNCRSKREIFLDDKLINTAWINKMDELSNSGGCVNDCCVTFVQRDWNEARIDVPIVEKGSRGFKKTDKIVNTEKCVIKGGIEVYNGEDL